MGQTDHGDQEPPVGYGQTFDRIEARQMDTGSSEIEVYRQ